MNIFTRFFWTALAVLFFALPAGADDGPPGISEFYQAAGQFNTWYFSIADLILVIGAICGLTGGIRVFYNWQMGQPRIDTQVASWFFSCLFLCLIGAAVRGLFGIH